jgi:hypothetical protein
MRKWYIPLTIAGIGGFGAFLLTEQGRAFSRWLRKYLQWNTDTLLEWNDAAEVELHRIQAALTALAESLEPHGELGH